MTKEQLAEIFTEWDRRYRSNPGKFMSEVEHLLFNDEITYGELCAEYFSVLSEELSM